MVAPLRSARSETPAGDAHLIRSDEPSRAHARLAFGLTDLSLLLMALIWGVNYTSVKYGTGLLDPLAFNGVRVTLAAVSLVIVAQRSEERRVGKECRLWWAP